MPTALVRREHIKSITPPSERLACPECENPTIARRQDCAQWLRGGRFEQRFYDDEVLQLACRGGAGAATAGYVMPKQTQTTTTTNWITQQLDGSENGPKG